MGRRACGSDVVGCGYVFDTYMSTWDRHPRLELAGVTDIDRARAEAVSSAYGLHLYASNEELMSDPTIDIVVNLTSIESHYEVTKAALLAGKHVYSEKPLCPSFDQAKDLVELAADKRLALSCAPSNALSDSTQTLWKAILDGAVGDVRIVYAEFDDNPIYLMSPEGWRSPTGAPWPYRHEYEAGCTHEHVGYHLTQLCSIFGPVESVTAFSKQTLPDKTAEPLDPTGHTGLLGGLPELQVGSGGPCDVQHRCSARPPAARYRQQRDAERRHLSRLPLLRQVRALRQALAQRSQGDLGAPKHAAPAAARRRWAGR